MFSPVQPVSAERPSTGLVATAITPNDGARWEAGMAWRPERCPTARGFSPRCGIENPFDVPVGGGDDAIVYYEPQAFRVSSECFTRAGAQADDYQRVRRQAEAVTSFMVARELQDGELTRANPYTSPAGPDQVNAHLASSAAVIEPGTWDPYAGLGRLEELARVDALGMDVFIHMPVRFVPLVVNALEKRGNLLYTETGARVVADAGYSGTGVLTAGTSEVQTVTITGAPTGGTFTLTYAGQTTAPIPFDANGAAVQDALLALSNVDLGEVTVTGAAGGPYTATFVADLGNVAQMTASGAGLTGGTAPAVGVVTATPGVAPAPAAGNWLYATGPVEVRLGDIVPVDITEWSTNRRMVTVDRMFAATFDPCNLHALAIAVPATA